MTEEEAKAKWCHATAYRTLYDDAARYPANANAKMNRCIGSACMAWRRQTAMIDRATGEPAIPGETAIGQLEERYSAHGYCGLAGAPR